MDNTSWICKLNDIKQSALNLAKATTMAKFYKNICIAN